MSKTESSLAWVLTRSRVWMATRDNERRRLSSVPFRINRLVAIAVARSNPIGNSNDAIDRAHSVMAIGYQSLHSIADERILHSTIPGRRVAKSWHSRRMEFPRNGLRLWHFLLDGGFRELECFRFEQYRIVCRNSRRFHSYDSERADDT